MAGAHAHSAGAPRIGVLALQGDFAAHERALGRRGAAAVPVREARDLEGVAALVLPGGESTTMLRLLDGNPLRERLVAAIRAGMPVLATCAGVILIAQEVRNPVQWSLDLLSVTVDRNAYGRQINSEIVSLAADPDAELGASTLEAVFIRAPRIAAVWDGVRVLARRGSDPVLVRQGNIIAATFHPELSEDSPVLDMFLTAPGGRP